MGYPSTGGTCGLAYLYVLSNLHSLQAASSLKKKDLDVGVPESLANTKSLAGFDRVLVLRDLLVCELGHEFKAGLDLLDGLGLEDTVCHCLCPDCVTDL